MRRRILLSALVLAHGAAATAFPPPAQAQFLGISAATPSYNPWVAAGLTYVPIAAAAAPGAIRSDPVYPGLQTFGLAVAVNPLPGMGQVYAGDPVRGFAILGGGAAMLGATAVANVVINRRGRFSQFDPAPDFNPMPYINIGYFTVAGLYSLWAAVDAYQLAERKNRDAAAPVGAAASASVRVAPPGALP